MWPSLALAAPRAEARTGELQQNRDKAKAIAAEISGLDAQIGSAVTRYSRATRGLEAVRQQLKENHRLQRLAYKELSLARATLVARAVAMYKHDDVTPMDAFFGAADLGDLVTQLTMVRTIARCDRDIVRTIESTKRELSDRAVKLAADERTAEKLVGTCKSELATIRSRLDERRAALAGVRSDIRRLVAETQKASPDPAPTVEPPDEDGGGGDDGSGPWWSLIQSAAASNGVSARGMYRLMMIESGGSASVVGPGRLLRPLPVRADHLEGQLEPLAVGEHHRRRRPDQGHGARHSPGLRSRLVGPLLHLGVPGPVTRAGSTGRPCTRPAGEHPRTRLIHRAPSRLASPIAVHP